MHLLKQKQRTAYELRNESGLTFRAIGEKMGIGAQRARQHYILAEKILNREPHWTDGLSNRVLNVLWCQGIETKEQAIDAVVSGRLVGKRGYGKKCHKELVVHLRDGLEPYATAAIRRIFSDYYSNELHKALSQLLKLKDFKSIPGEQILNSEVMKWFKPRDKTKP